jgi:hypothetical protein
VQSPDTAEDVAQEKHRKYEKKFSIINNELLYNGAITEETDFIIDINATVLRTAFKYNNFIDSWVTDFALLFLSELLRDLV